MNHQLSCNVLPEQCVQRPAYPDICPIVDKYAREILHKEKPWRK